ncbi:hypothetical protein CPB86DRAFT_10877 [Serendipita vermifera]|nr:hypothetical protein CPB86DRAFT_10877 [Serendipita vermifera]
MLAVAANRHSSFGSLNIFSRLQDLQGGYLAQNPTAMDRYQQSSVSPVHPTLVTPIEDGDPLSVPNTPLSPTFSHSNLFGTSRLDGPSQSISQNSPPSPTLPKPVKRKRLAKVGRPSFCYSLKRGITGSYRLLLGL